jgi:hypothetical protein
MRSVKKWNETSHHDQAVKNSQNEIAVGVIFGVGVDWKRGLAKQINLRYVH